MIGARWLATAALVVVLGARAHAAPLALGEVRAEADVADEAGAVSLLVRSSLGGLRPDALAALPAAVTSPVGAAIAAR